MTTRVTLGPNGSIVESGPHKIEQHFSVPVTNSKGVTVQETASGYIRDVSRVSLWQDVNEADISNLEAIQPYATPDEEAAAYQDPEYRRSASFRQMHAKRVAVTHKLR